MYDSNEAIGTQPQKEPEAIKIISAMHQELSMFAAKLSPISRPEVAEKAAGKTVATQLELRLADVLERIREISRRVHI